MRAVCFFFFFFFSSRRRHTRFDCDWSSDVCSSDLAAEVNAALNSCDAATIIAEAARLDAFNNLGCPIDQQGNCSNASFTPKDTWRNAVREYVAMALRPARLVYWY